ncbi:MAG TPA: hypothetical protein VHE37_05485 [Nevskiaceae bacterium]|nr:hypothetical protein [Nevskiaceae bacterium]
MSGAVLAVKLLASPLLIGLASIGGRRWGPNVAGLLGGLPLVGGPVIAALWMQGGPALAQQVALAAPAGLWANMVYFLVVGYTSARLRWWAAIPLGWCCYLLAALAVSATGLAYSLPAGLAVIPGLWLTATRALPQPRVAATRVHLPRAELYARMAAAALMVATLSSAAMLIGPGLTGVLSGAPVAAVVIPAFTFAKAGRDALLHALRGFLTGLTGYAAFCLVLGHGAVAPGAWVWLPALAAAVLFGLTATHWSRPVFDLVEEDL